MTFHDIHRHAQRASLNARIAAEVGFLAAVILGLATVNIATVAWRLFL
jgi:hypothetical protein